MGLRIDVRAERSKEFESLIRGLENTAQMQHALARGLNEHIRKQEQQAVTMVAAQTGVGAGRVKAISRVKTAWPARSMEAAVEFRDSAIPAGALTRRSWNRGMPGARHGDWPSYTRKGGLMKGTFTVRQYGGAIFRRIGKSRGPIARVWGPVLPNELLREDMPAYPQAGVLVQTDLERRVIRSVMYAFGF